MRLLVFSLLCIIWGFSWIAIKMTLDGLPPFLGAALRFMVAVPILSTYAFLRKVPLRLPVSALWMISLTALLIYGLDYGLIYWAEQYITPGVTAVLFATFPLFTGLFSQFLVPSESPSFSTYLGLLLAFLGICVTFSEEWIGTAAEFNVLLATAAVLAAAASAALATVLIKKRLMGFHPVSITLLQLLLGSGGLLFFSVLLEEPGRAVFTTSAVWGLLYLGVVASALAFTLYYWLLGQSSAVSLSTMIYITPIVALFSDWLVYGSGVSLQVLGGMFLIFAGISIAEVPKYRAHLAQKAV